MLELTFAEQVKIVLSRKGMTIKELAELIEKRTGKKMSRQNLTQRLSRDNFQEQDMRMIAGILECPFRLSILDDSIPAVQVPRKATEEKITEPARERVFSAVQTNERDITIGELLDIHERLDAIEEAAADIEQSGAPEHTEEPESSEQETEKPRGWRSYLQRRRHRNEEEQENTAQEELTAGPEPEAEPDDAGEDEMDLFETEAGYEDDIYITSEIRDIDYLTSEEEPQEEFQREFMDYDEDTEIGEVNPYTGREYQTNSVRMHPDRIGYVQVYDRADHRWTDMTEWAFLGYQERKKALLGNDYEPPIYLD